MPPPPVPPRRPPDFWNDWWSRHMWQDYYRLWNNDVQMKNPRAAPDVRDATVDAVLNEFKSLVTGFPRASTLLNSMTVEEFVNLPDDQVAVSFYDVLSGKPIGAPAKYADDEEVLADPSITDDIKLLLRKIKYVHHQMWSVAGQLKQRIDYIRQQIGVPPGEKVTLGTLGKALIDTYSVLGRGLSRFLTRPDSWFSRAVGDAARGYQNRYRR